MSDQLSPLEAAEILGVATDSDEESINQAFRKMAREHHPDVSDDPESTANFQQINRARKVLLNANSPTGIENSRGGNSPKSSTSTTSSTNWQRTKRDNNEQHSTHTSHSEKSTEGGDTKQESQDNQNTENSKENPWDGEQWEKEREQNKRSGRYRHRKASRRNQRQSTHQSRTSRGSNTGSRSQRGNRARSSHSRHTGGYSRWNNWLDWGRIRSRTARFILVLGVAITVFPLILPFLSPTYTPLYFNFRGESLLVSTGSTVGYVLSVSGITIGVIVHQLFSGLPSTDTQTKYRTNKNINMSTYSIIITNLLGMGLAVIAQFRGYSLGGFRYLFKTFNIALLPGTLGLLLGVYVTSTVFTKEGRPRQEYMDYRTVLGGVVGLAIGLMLSLVKIESRKPILYITLQPISLTGHPWIPEVVISIFGITPLLNFLAGAIMITSLIGSATLVVWEFPQLRSLIEHSQSGSYARRFLGSLCWKLLVVVPSIIFIWLRVVEKQTLAPPFKSISQSSLGVVILLLPTLLVCLPIILDRLPILKSKNS